MAYSEDADALRQRIAKIDTQIDQTLEAEQFSLDSGQARTNVRRPSLDNLWLLRERLVRRLEAIEPGGLISVDYRRRG